jgi:solute carrier family 25 uncoupling protein 8/9
MITGPLEEGQFPSLSQKILSALITGGLAITVANPTDLVKIKLQAQGINQIRGMAPVYTSSFDCYRKIVKEGGVKALWTGLGTNVIRNSLINAAELASYDQFK